MRGVTPRRKLTKQIGKLDFEKIRVFIENSHCSCADMEISILIDTDDLQIENYTLHSQSYQIQIQAIKYKYKQSNTNTVTHTAYSTCSGYIISIKSFMILRR